MLYRAHRTGFEITAVVVIGTDYTCIGKADYHTITTTATPHLLHRKSNAMFILCVLYSLLTPRML